MSKKLVIEKLEKRYGNSVFAVKGISLSVEEGTFVSLLGPSGCGKTTTLRMIAGLEKPTSGRIIVNDKILSDDYGMLAPEDRGMGMVFQNYALWPHMTVYDNVAYGLKLRKLPKNDIENKVTEVLKLIDMEKYARRNSTQLSGGQQQRVALARAIVIEPSILLLDEPLSNLDAFLRESMRFELRDLQQRLGITTVYVTHSQEEGLVLSDMIAVMKQGEILQMGTPEEIYHYPRNRFVAGFMGVANFFKTEKISQQGNEYYVQIKNGQRLKVVYGCKFNPNKDNLTIMIRPETVKLTKTEEKVSYNQVRARIANVSFTGNLVNYFVHIKGENDLFRIQSTPPITAREGEEVNLLFSPENVIILED